MQKKIKHLLNNLEEYLAGALLLSMAAIAFVNVVSRFTFKFSISYIEELEIYLYVWLVMLGSSIAFKKGKHLCVSLIVEKMPKKVQKVVQIIVALLSIAFFAILLKYSITQIQDEILLNVTTTSMGVPMWWYTLGLPIGSVLIIIRIIQRTVVELKESGDE
ncbi:MAG: TRAP transporter small permease [Bacillota bacterium]